MSHLVLTDVSRIDGIGPGGFALGAIGLLLLATWLLCAAAYLRKADRSDPWLGSWEPLSACLPTRWLVVLRIVGSDS